MNKQIKKGNLNFDQSGRAYPDNPQIKENWDCIWENDGRYYELIGDTEHKEWEQVKVEVRELSVEKREEKIERLRKEHEDSRLIKHKNLQWQTEFNLRWDLHVGDPVFLTMKGKTISGYIVKKHKDGTYDVKTPYGIITTTKEYSVRKRFVEDLSGVIVPEELKTYTTPDLLKLLNWYRRGHTQVLNDATIISREQIKAELKTRPHIPTKKEKSIFSKK
jgi:hypothetical protein